MGVGRVLGSLDEPWRSPLGLEEHLEESWMSPLGLEESWGAWMSLGSLGSLDEPWRSPLGLEESWGAWMSLGGTNATWHDAGQRTRRHGR